MKSSPEARFRAQLFLGDRPRVEIPLTPGTPGSLPTWLAVGLPGPLAEERAEGRLLADPRIPESEIVFRWSTALAVPRPLRVLTISVGDQSWTLEQDIRNPERWLEQTDPDTRRAWS